MKDLLTQKIMGLVLIALGGLTSVILDGDITFAVFTVPIGIWMFVTKKSLFTNDK